MNTIQPPAKRWCTLHLFDYWYNGWRKPCNFQTGSHSDMPDHSGVDLEHLASYPDPLPPDDAGDDFPQFPHMPMPAHCEDGEKADTTCPNLRDLVSEALDAGCTHKSQIMWYVRANGGAAHSENAIAYWLRHERQECKLASEIQQATPAALVRKISACDSRIAESHKRRDQGYLYWLYRRVQFWEALERRGYDPVQELDRLLDERRAKKRRK